MSPKLKPLLLPQIVEQRKREEELQEQQKQQHQLLLLLQQQQQQQQQQLQQQQLQQQQLQQSQQSLPAQQTTPDSDLSYVFYTNNSSSSDVASHSPVTPTYSRSTHSRYSGSTSSLELMPSMPSSCSDSPASPSQVAHSVKSGKRQLPDVQEDPSEREEDESTLVPEPTGLYNCLCDEPCSHHRTDQPLDTINSHNAFDFDYDLGFLSDSDFTSSARSPKKRARSGSVSPLSGFSTRFGARFNTIARWKSSARRVNASVYPASETSLDFRPSLTMSRGPSSRSSSLSAPARRLPDRSNEPPVPISPAMSLYGSTESFELPAPLDIEKANVRRSLERDRSMATTPLLPPLLTETVSSQTASLQPSPLQSPAVVPSPSLEGPVPQLYPSPPLSTRPSIASFRPITGAISSPTSYTPTDIPAPAPMPNLLEHYDEWSDRLGHANFTITPKPYQPEDASVEILRTFRADWDLAKVNYTKHLVRTGEHYGTTSKTYALTEAKWAETERQWHLAQTDLIDRVAKLGSEAAFATLQWHSLREEVSPAAVPRMQLDAEKFPERGDEDIVGPMVRDAVMVRDVASDDKKNSASMFFKNLAEKVGLRR